MSFPLKPPPRVRISFPEAMSKIVEILAEGKTMSVATLSRITGIDRRTVSKVLETLNEIQKSLRDKELLLGKVGNTYAVQLIQRTAEIKKRISETSSKVSKRIRRR